jgi:glutamate/tyrosine decarboxylase-like PLP-dependent enzyme
MRDDLTDKVIFEQAKNYAFDYIDSVKDRPVFPTDIALEKLDIFDESLPIDPQPGSEILKQLHTFGSPATVAQTGGRYFGFVNGNVVPSALAARWLADVWDQNACLYVMSPIAAKLEQICQDWLVDLFGLPQNTVAGLVGGTSVATLCGLAAARYTLLKQMGWDINAQGLRDAPPFRVVASEQAHSSVFKALVLLGIGREQVELVTSDEQGRIAKNQLPEIDDRTLLILQAGNVNTGAFDDFYVLCDQANRAGAWVHVDGAFGLWAAASESKRHLTRGVENADSWSVDGHKTLNTPYDCGVILCRHPKALMTAMQTSGAYLQFSAQRDGMLLGPDMSRRARSIELWATLKALGRSGIEQLVDILCNRARMFADQLEQKGFRILNDVVFNQVLLACDTPEQTRTTLDAIQRSGVLWCGPTTWMGQPAIRISVCSWSTTPADVLKCVEVFDQARGESIFNGL